MVAAGGAIFGGLSRARSRLKSDPSRLQNHLMFQVCIRYLDDGHGAGCALDPNEIIHPFEYRKLNNKASLQAYYI
jgi:hypothetical protein